MNAKVFSSVVMLLLLGIMTLGQVVPQLPAGTAAVGGNSNGSGGGGTGGNATIGGGGGFLGSAFSRRLRNNNYCIYLHHNHIHSMHMKNCAHMPNGEVGNRPSFSKPHRRIGGYDGTMDFSLKSMRVNLRAYGYSGSSSFMTIGGGGNSTGTPQLGGAAQSGVNTTGGNNRPVPLPVR